MCVPLPALHSVTFEPDLPTHLRTVRTTYADTEPRDFVSHDSGLCGSAVVFLRKIIIHIHIKSYTKLRFVSFSQLDFTYCAHGSTLTIDIGRYTRIDLTICRFHA